MDWQSAEHPDRPEPVRTSSKRALSASPSLEDQPRLSLHSLNDSDTGKRLRSDTQVPAAFAQALAAHQAIFDGHSCPPTGWSDLSKRLLALQACITSHPVRLRAWSSSALAALQSARDAEANGDLAGRTQHVDGCTTTIREAVEARNGEREEVREKLGAPWTAEEGEFWTTLASLDTAEDNVAEILLSLALHGFAHAQ